MMKKAMVQVVSNRFVWAATPHSACNLMHRPPNGWHWEEERIEDIKPNEWAVMVRWQDGNYHFHLVDNG